MNLYTEEIKLKEENRLFYSDTGETKELGCIGHLRGDFGHDGKEFWTTWFPHENHEKNDEVFREIFDRVINLCREKGNPLFGRGDMRAYCREHPECRLETGYSPTWGFRIPTQEYMLYLRCCPDVVGDYNFYVYAYHIAVKYYNEYRSGAAKTLKSIQITLAARLEKFNLESLAAMTVTDELELDMLGKEKTALFALIPDNDT